MRGPARNQAPARIRFRLSSRPMTTSKSFTGSETVDPVSTTRTGWRRSPSLAASNSSICALAALDRVYCSNDLFYKGIFSTLPEIDRVPVQPDRSLPLTAVILR